VSRPMPTPDEDPTQEPNVRTHRMMYPNRRPLLISAILVALTSIPTIIVVAAGTATLHDREPARPPVIADPNRGPVVVQPGSSSGLREHPPLASEYAHGLPPQRGSSRAAGSGGGGEVPTGTGISRSTSGGLPPATRSGAPATKGPPNNGGTTGSSGTNGHGGTTGTTGNGGASNGGGGSNDGGSNDGDEPDVGRPEDCPTPEPTPTPTQSSPRRIDDDAWPGWDQTFGG
jgi:hypothetical protein